MKMFRVKFEEEKKVWCSCDAPLLHNPKESLGKILLKSMELHGPKISQINDDTGEQFTFDEIRMKTIRAAQNLRKRGYDSKHVVAIIAGNVANLAPAVYASLCLGWPIVAMYTAMEKQSILRMFELSEPKIIFCEVKVYDLVVECLGEVGKKAKIFTFSGTKGESEAVENLFEETGTEEHFVPVDVDVINDTAFIMCTSGSTGPSKGVCLSQATLANEIDTTSHIYADEIIFNPSSLFWISGLFTILMSTICGGTRVITTEKFTPQIQLRIIEEHKVTVVENQSSYLLDMLKCGLLPKTDLSCLKHLIAGGLRVPASIMEEFNSYLPNGSVNNGYGLTEIGYNISIDFPTFTGRGGRLTNGFTVKVVDENGNRCGAGVDGEICIKGRYKFLGYCKNPKLTEAAIDEEGFFKTGDIGNMDEDGYLCILDRKKHVIDYHGDWVYPSEIEEVLLKSPEIKSVCAVGVRYDPFFELPAAVVVRANGSQITEDEVSKMVEDNLVDDCKLRGGVYFIESIPMSATGKPLIRELKELATKLYKMNVENGKLRHKDLFAIDFLS